MNDSFPPGHLKRIKGASLSLYRSFTPSSSAPAALSSLLTINCPSFFYAFFSPPPTYNLDEIAPLSIAASGITLPCLALSPCSYKPA